MALTAVQLAARENRLTASRVACLMNGDREKILDLWKELVGDPAYVPEDLSGVWAVRLGECTEGLQLDWFERKYGPVTRRGEVVIGDPDWMACTLDGWSVQHNCPIEAKHVGGREPPEVIIQRYQAQLHWQMMVTGTSKCALSVIMGANEPVVDFIPCDDAYAAELLKRATVFMQCVDSLTPPVPIMPAAPAIIPSQTYDMTGQNAWASYAAEWLANIAAKRTVEKCEKELKALVPLDAVKCTGHGVRITRARNGNLSLREESQA
jgi:predicted phage-related endonuclease